MPGVVPKWRSERARGHERLQMCDCGLALLGKVLERTWGNNNTDAQHPPLEIMLSLFGSESWAQMHFKSSLSDLHMQPWLRAPTLVVYVLKKDKQDCSVTDVPGYICRPLFRLLKAW